MDQLIPAGTQRQNYLMSDEGICPSLKDFFISVFESLPVDERLNLLLINRNIYVFCLEAQQNKIKEIQTILAIAEEFLQNKGYQSAQATIQSMGKGLEMPSSLPAIEKICLQSIEAISLLIFNLKFVDQKAFKNRLLSHPCTTIRELVLDGLLSDSFNIRNLNCFLEKAQPFCKLYKPELCDELKTIKAEFEYNKEKFEPDYCHKVYDKGLALLKKHHIEIDGLPLSCTQELPVEVLFNTIFTGISKNINIENYIKIQYANLKQMLDKLIKEQVTGRIINAFDTYTSRLTNELQEKVNMTLKNDYFQWVLTLAENLFNKIHIFNTKHKKLPDTYIEAKKMLLLHYLYSCIACNSNFSTSYKYLSHITDKRFIEKAAIQVMSQATTSNQKIAVLKYLEKHFSIKDPSDKRTVFRIFAYSGYYAEAMKLAISINLGESELIALCTLYKKTSNVDQKAACFNLVKEGILEALQDPSIKNTSKQHISKQELLIRGVLAEANKEMACRLTELLWESDECFYELKIGVIAQNAAKFTIEQLSKFLSYVEKPALCKTNLDDLFHFILFTILTKDSKDYKYELLEQILILTNDKLTAFSFLINKSRSQEMALFCLKMFEKHCEATCVSPNGKIPFISSLIQSQLFLEAQILMSKLGVQAEALDINTQVELIGQACQHNAAVYAWNILKSLAPESYKLRPSLPVLMVKALVHEGLFDLAKQAAALALGPLQAMAFDIIAKAESKANSNHEFI